MKTISSFMILLLLQSASPLATKARLSLQQTMIEHF